MHVFIKIFVTNGPTVYFSRIFQILIFLPQLYDYYLSSSIFDLKISYILNMFKSQPPPVFLKSFLLDDVKNKTGLLIFLFTSDQYEMLYIYFFFSLQPPKNTS